MAIPWQQNTSIILLIFCLLQTWTNCIDLKENIITNGNFSNPMLTSQTTIFKDYVIQGWSCSQFCEISNCANFQRVNVGKRVIYNNCEGQVIDLNSKNINQIVTQIIEAKAGIYLLSLNYFFPIYRANKKTFFVYFNGQLVFRKSPNVYNQFQKYQFQTEVEVFQGTNNLTLTMEGYLGDGAGFNVNNVSLRMIYSRSFQQMINETFHNSVVQTVFSLPAQRAFLGEIITIFADLDRWQFYGYHKRKHSHNEGIFLQNINDLMQLKGNLLKSFFDSYLKFPSALSDFFGSLNFKSNYKDIVFLSVSTDSSSFLQNNSDLFIYSLPNAFASWLVLLAMFKITYRWKLSKLFRKYSLFAVSLFFVFEGNIEQFSFYLFQQFKLFYSASFEHRLLNFGLVLFCFLLLFASVACFLWLKWHYQQLSVYFTEEYRTNLKGIICCTLDRGIMCFAFGFVNSFLINCSSTQLICLISLELLWVFLRAYYASTKSFKADLYIWVQIVSGFNRVLYLSSSLIFEYKPFSIFNDYFHKNIILVFFIIWSIKLIITLKEITILSIEIINYFDPKDKIPKTPIAQPTKSKAPKTFHINFSKNGIMIFQNKLYGSQKSKI